jgi:ADP-dependent phosphofructokinase/glucokinase
VSIDDTVRRLLPGSVSWVCSAAHDSTDPHVIVQFPPGFAVTVGGRLIVAPAGDRVILANDPPHRELLIAEGLGDLIAAADVIVHSSFNVIQDDEVLRDRIGAVLRHQRRRASGSIVFFEDAAYHRPALAAVVRQLLVPSVDVWSMNETEASAYLGRRIDTADTAAVLPALRELHRMFPVPTLIVHSARWAVAIGPRAEAYREALLLGTSIAGARYRVGDALTAADVIDVLDGERQHEGLRLAEALAAHPDIVVVAAPAVDTPQPTTIGLGDTFVGGMVAALSIGLAAARANLETA